MAFGEIVFGGYRFGETTVDDMVVDFTPEPIQGFYLDNEQIKGYAIPDGNIGFKSGV